VTETCVWTDPDGTSTTLDVDWDAADRFMPRPVFDETAVPGQPGGRLRSVRHDIREFSLPIWIDAASEAALRTAERNLVASMDPVRGLGTVRVTSPVGDQREITCAYSGGLGLDEKPEVSGPQTQRAPITFRCWDPYWYAVSSIVTPHTIGETPTFFPIFPIRLSASQIVVDTTLNNTGDVETWPVWTLTGPGSVIRLRNITTGKMIDLSTLVLAAGESVTIDTRPGFKTITRDDGTNLFPYITAASSLWSLQRGVNSVHLEMSGASAGSSALTSSYKPRYLSP
jgi:hypothetical protein